MEEKKQREYENRTPKDYLMSFKLGVVQEVERGQLIIKRALVKYGIQSHGTVLNWLRKYGNFDWEDQSTIAYYKKRITFYDIGSPKLFPVLYSLKLQDKEIVTAGFTV